MATKFSAILLALTLAACTTGTATPTSAPSVPVTPSVLPSATTIVPPPSPTVTLPPTATLAPTLRPTALPPTATPYPPLQTNGPYFVYAKGDEDRRELVMLDIDGAGKKTIKLPEGAWIPGTDAISPNGQWLAFYLGTAGGPFEENQSGPFDLTLNILHINNGQWQTITHILSVDYPNNFTALAKNLGETLPKEFVGASQDDIVKALRDEFEGTIRSFDWSSDSQHLAFAGEMDGPSADLYVYDLPQKSIRRLSQGPEGVLSITWSPDNQWILYGSSFAIGDSINYRSVQSGGQRSNKLITADWFYGWLSNTEFLTYKSTNGIGSYDLESVNIDTGVIRDVWPDPYSHFAFDKSKNELVITSEVQSRENGPLGTYLVNLSDLKMTLLTDTPFAVIDSYLSYTYAEQKITPILNMVLVDKDSTIAAQISNSLYTTSISPNGKIIALYDDPYLKFYGFNGSEISETSIPMLSRMFWRPDSLGFFFISDENLYYMNLTSGKPELIDQNFTDPYSFDPIWVTQN